MIHGIGTDLVAVARLERMLERHGASAARRILTPAELEEFAAQPFPARFLAKRFAAKEAFSKALGTGVRGVVALRAVGVAHDALGKPRYVLAPPVQALLDAGGLRAHLSLSDEAEYVVAFAILDQELSR